MRVDVKKFLFIGLEEDRLKFFKKAQEAGIIHFIEKKAGKAKEVPQDIQEVISAIKVLRHLPVMEQEELEEYSLANGIAHKILQLNHNLEKLLEEQRITKLEITRIDVFGDFSKQDIAYIEKVGNVHIQFFFAKQSSTEEMTLPDDMLYVGSRHGLDYFIAINSQPTQYEKFVEMKIEEPLGVLLKREKEIERKLHESDQRLKRYEKYNRFLHHALIYKLNSYNLHAAQEDIQPLIDNTLFSVEGWVPVNKIDELYALVSQLRIHVDEIAIEPSDAIPTYLENSGVRRIGEDVIRIYDTPSPTDKDPSLWVLASFSLFFAFIVGDAGYGLVFLLLALYLRYRFPNLTGLKRRILNLFTILSVTIIVWGLLTTSFFGISFAPESPMRKISLMHWLVEKKAQYHMTHQDEVYAEWTKKYPAAAQATTPQEFIQLASTTTNGKTNYELMNKFSDAILFELALFIGVVHIILGYLRYLNRNWAGIGWILVIIGAYLYFPYFLQATSLIHYAFGVPKSLAMPNGLYLIFGGLAIAFVLSLIKNKLLGLLEPMTAIQVFADVLSYLRLYALGLAGAIVISIINETAAGSHFVVAFLLLLLGHSINMVLNVMSGLIHGLRLNFVEWYHYSFEGGGKQFTPLRKETIEGD